MAEIGIDISGHRSKGLDEFEGRRFDYVVMVCDDKQTDCPFFPGGKEFIHHAFDDPAVFALVLGGVGPRIQPPVSRRFEKHCGFGY